MPTFLGPFPSLVACLRVGFVFAYVAFALATSLLAAKLAVLAWVAWPLSGLWALAVAVPALFLAWLIVRVLFVDIPRVLRTFSSKS